MASFRYRLNSRPSAFSDGSGMIVHDIDAIYSEDGGTTWSTVPGRHKSILIPATEMEVVMDMPDATGPQKSAKNTAYKQSLVDNLNTQNTPITGWTVAQMQALVDANNAASLEADRADTFITVTLGQSYPVEFSI